MNQISHILLSNHLINVGFVSWFSAQFIKTILTFFRFRQLRLERMFGAGGMPSSHSALVCSLSMAMAQREGYNSPLFALTLAFAMVVMYDAMGVRRAAGEQAKILNQMMFGFKDMNQILGELDKEIEEALEIRETHSTQQKELKEFLGHTPLEVLGGALLGILVASILR